MIFLAVMGRSIRSECTKTVTLPPTTNYYCWFHAEDARDVEKKTASYCFLTKETHNFMQNVFLFVRYFLFKESIKELYT